MTGAVFRESFPPDNPLRRLPWVLAGALLLVLLALLGTGRLLTTPVRPRPQRKPLQAKIYELPAAPGSQASKPTLGAHPQQSGRRSAAAASPPRQASRQAQPSAPQQVAHATQPPSPPAPPNEGAQLVRPAQPRAGTPVGHARPQQPAKPRTTRPSPRRHPAKPRSRHLARPHAPKPRARPTINWGALQSQIASAARQSVPSLPRTHDPHTLVARYYIASVLSKLQRIGDMNHPTNLIGEPAVRMVVGAHGELLHLTLVHSSGNGALDHAALQIARESAPFAPFPDRLERQTSHIALICYMDFEGYRQLHTEY